ncbi:MAG: leucine-rich repeat domain-containing protein [Treponema sp.]|nr:leucine-rich repeat domain-containing protein [Treponema sp.]
MLQNTNNAFQNCTGLTDITIPDSITSIGSRAFLGCSSLESFTITLHAA